MYKKYIIEKKDLDNLPSSYKDVAINYSGNYSIIQKKVNEIRKLNKKINFLNNDIEILLNNTSKTLGARSQKKLPRETALFIAKCNSGHKDISLNF